MPIKLNDSVLYDICQFSMPHNITISLNTTPGDSALRQGIEDLAIELDTTLAAIGRAALAIAVENPNLIDSRLVRRWPGRRLKRRLNYN